MALTKEEKEYVLVHYRGCGPKEMAQRLGRTQNEVLGFYKNHHLNSGLTGRFSKGHVPWTKGKTQAEIAGSEEAYIRMRDHCFKAGHMPHNHLPVGTELVKNDGYWWRKIAEPNKWRQLHILIYEEIHEVRLGREDVIIFLDGNRNNLDPENLCRITRREHRVMNTKGLRSESAEITKTGLQVARLAIAIRGREKR